MSNVTGLALPADYARWHERLANEFFGGRRDQPVVMFVDRDELQEIADENEDGLRSLASAVRDLVEIGHGAAMFTPVMRAQEVWSRGARSEPPPTLPVLALSVLAASEMRRDASVARHNYYIRLAQALLPDGADHEIDTLRHHLRERGAFTDVASMWQRIDQWLDERAGAFGISTIREHPDLTRIGYPLSQTLVRRSDRAALTRFFDRMNLKGAGVPGPESLLTLLKVWTHHRSQGLSDRFVEVLDDPELQGFLGPVIHGLAVAWDGKVITAEGLRRLDIRLALDLDRASAWLVIPAVPDVPGDILTGAIDGSEFSILITPDPHSSMFEAEGLPPVTAAALAEGFVARGSACVAEFQKSKILVMIDNADAGGWTSVDAVQAYEEHVFAAAPDVTADVERALAMAADSGWRQLSPEIASRVLSGYTVYYSVTFSDRDTLDAALRILPGTVAANIRVGTTVRPRLINGLPLFRNISRDTYLAGGEPDLELPVGAEPRDVYVVLDQSAPQRFRASIFPIPFCRFGPYEPGPHSIEADGETLTFVVSHGLSSDWQPPGAGGLSWTHGVLQDTTEAAEVCGAVTPTQDPADDVLVRRGALENWLVERTGLMTKLCEPEAPAFLPKANFMYFEVGRDQGAWLLQKRRTGWEAVRLRVVEPTFQGLTTEDHVRWAEIVESVQLADPMWKLYMEAWRRFSGR